MQQLSPRRRLILSAVADGSLPLTMRFRGWSHTTLQAHLLALRLDGFVDETLTLTRQGELYLRNSAEVAS